MNTAEITRIQIIEYERTKEIRADFSNDRHHSVVIIHPHRIENVANALMTLARQIMADPELRPSRARTFGEPDREEPMTATEIRKRSEEYWRQQSEKFGRGS